MFSSCWLHLFPQVFVANKKRFFKEYGLAQEDEPKKGKKPGRIGCPDESHNLMKYFILKQITIVHCQTFQGV